MHTANNKYSEDLDKGNKPNYSVKVGKNVVVTFIAIENDPLEYQSNSILC